MKLAIFIDQFHHLLTPVVAKQMKKCDWCGQEYPDSTESGAVDGRALGLENARTLLDGGVGVASAETMAEQAPAIEAAPALSSIVASGRRLQIFELALVCVTAFGGSILYSAGIFFNHTTRPTGTGALRWIHSGLLEVTSLALLWYVLQRRSISLKQLGLTWKKTDIGWSIVLYLAGNMAFGAAYAGIYGLGFASSTEGQASARVMHMLFGTGVSWLAIAFAFLNPFFEELIVRAFLMTEVRALTGSVAAAVAVSTLIQMSYHFYQGGPLAIAESVMFFLFSLYYARTNRITPVILAHFYLDLVATLYVWIMKR